MTADTDTKQVVQTPDDGDIGLKLGDDSPEASGLSPREGTVTEDEGENTGEGQVLSEDAEILKQELAKITVEPPKMMYVS